MCKVLQQESGFVDQSWGHGADKAGVLCAQEKDDQQDQSHPEEFLIWFCTLNLLCYDQRVLWLGKRN